MIVGDNSAKGRRKMRRLKKVIVAECIEFDRELDSGMHDAFDDEALLKALESRLQKSIFKFLGGRRKDAADSIERI